MVGTSWSLMPRERWGKAWSTANVTIATVSNSLAVTVTVTVIVPQWYTSSISPLTMTINLLTFGTGCGEIGIVISTGGKSVAQLAAVSLYLSYIF